MRNQGWKYESSRHALAARGVPTSTTRSHKKIGLIQCRDCTRSYRCHMDHPGGSCLLEDPEEMKGESSKLCGPCLESEYCGQLIGSDGLCERRRKWIEFHRNKSRGISRKVHVRERIPSSDLTDAQLVSRIKAMYPREDKQALYGRFVQERSLRPGIDAKEFYEIYDCVGPDMYIEDRSVDFKPTHRKKDTGILTMIWDDERGVHHFIDERGSTGSNPPFMKTEDYYDILER